MHNSDMREECFHNTKDDDDDDDDDYFYFSYYDYDYDDESLHIYVRANIDVIAGCWPAPPLSVPVNTRHSEEHLTN